MDVEHLFFDTAIALTPTLSGGSVIPSLNLIPQNTTESGRVGREVVVKSVALRFTLSLPQVVASGTLPDGNTVRVIVFVDHQCNGATAVVLDVLQTANIHSFSNLSNSGRFTILMDEFRDLVALSTAITPGGNFNSPSVHLENIHEFDVEEVLEFSGVDGTIDELRSNNFGVLFISHDGSAEMDRFTRIRYSDD